MAGGGVGGEADIPRAEQLTQELERIIAQNLNTSCVFK